jgi:2-deoxy-D-gluconate 3-dehydrogenase
VRLARDGYDLALVQRGGAAGVRDAVEGLGRRASVHRTDLSDPDAAQACVGEVIGEHGRLDALVLNAGTIERHDALDFPREAWERTLALNLTAPFLMAQAAGRRFVEQGSGGRIVFVASVLAFQGGVRVPAYAAAKGGVRQLVMALANEWAGRGINVNAVAPGYVETELTTALRQDAERSAQLGARIPAGRWGTPADIAGAVAFLCSPDAAYVHGQTLPVDGGWLAR